MNKLPSPLIPGCKADEVQGGEAGLPPGGDKNKDWLEGAVRLDGSIGWLVHGGHAGAVEAACIPLDVALQRYWPHAWLEIEQALHTRSTAEAEACLSCLQDVALAAYRRACWPSA